jgi:hypothetical protein
MTRAAEAQKSTELFLILGLAYLWYRSSKADLAKATAAREQADADLAKATADKAKADADLAAARATTTR